MGADCFFRMGATHQICQDYAVAGESNGYQYALLADGCSGVAVPGQPGSPFTDFGARFVVRAAQRRVAFMWPGDFPLHSIMTEASDAATILGFDSTALDATLLVAVTDPRGNVMTHQMGDGVMAWRGRDGVLHYRQIEFESGMPFYPSYTRDAGRLEAYLHPSDGERAESAGWVTIKSNAFVPGRGWTGITEQRTLVDQPLTGVWTMGLSREATELVLLMSDGVETFQTSNGTSMPVEQVLEQLFDFKGFVGQFIVRRCTRFLQKFCTEYGWSHGDDFSVAGIYLEAP